MSQLNSQSNSEPKRVTVLGSGSWGTALANHLSLSGHEVRIWGLSQADLKSIDQKAVNPSYFPDVILSRKLTSEIDLQTSVRGAEVVVLSVPSSGMREVAKEINEELNPSCYLVNTAKGLEADSLKRMSQVLEESCPKVAGITTLSGPSFAHEVIRDLPTAVTIASKKAAAAEEIAKVFHHRRFRVYTSTDIIGVDLGGALKNVIALAVGICDGKDLGLNARAALTTRGLAEISRLIVSLGGSEHTVQGLSVLGDLLLTCTGDLSRNRQVGLRLGRGEKLPEILASLGQVAEGVKTTPKVLELANKQNIDMPITTGVNAILTGSQTIDAAVEALFAREAGEE